MAELLEPLRTQVLHQRRDQLHGRRRRRRRWRASRRASPTARSTSSTASPSTTTDWHFNVRPSNTEPLLRLNLGADTRGAHGGEARPRPRRHPRGLRWTRTLTRPRAGARRRRSTRRHARRHRRPAASSSRTGYARRACAPRRRVRRGRRRAVPPARPTGARRLRHGRLRHRRRPRPRLPARAARAGRGRARLRAACLGRPATRWSSPSATRATPKRRWPAPEQALARGCAPVCVASGGALAALAERARPAAACACPAAAAARRRSATSRCRCWRRSRRPACARELRRRRRRGGRAAAQADNDALGPRPRGRANAGQALARRLHEKHGRRVRRRPHACRRPGAGRARSTRTPRLRPSATSCRSSTTTSSWAGRACRTWRPRPLAVFLRRRRRATRASLRRAELTAARLEARGVAVEQVGRAGRSRLARLFSLVQLGDYASFYLALLYGVDPTPVGGDPGRSRPSSPAAPAPDARDRRRRRARADRRRARRARRAGGRAVPGAPTAALLTRQDLRPAAPFAGRCSRSSPRSRRRAASASSSRSSGAAPAPAAPAPRASPRPGALLAVADHVNLELRGPLTGRWPAGVPRDFPPLTGIYQPAVVRARGGARVYSSGVVVAGVADAAAAHAVRGRGAPRGGRLRRLRLPGPVRHRRCVLRSRRWPPAGSRGADDHHEE